MLQLLNVSKTYAGEDRPIIQNIAFSIPDGETIVLLGSSGAGKSTLLGMLNGVITPSHGTIYLDQQDISTLDAVALRRSIGCVFQHSCLMPHWTVEDNIATVLRLAGVSKAIRIRRAHELLDFIQLDPKLYAKRWPSQLSGGQQQRVNVARALANDPQYLLMDEPFSALDAVTRLSLQSEVLRLKQQLQKTIVFVTHDLSEAFYLADRLVVMQAGQVVQIGTVQELNARPCPALAQLLLARQDSVTCHTEGAST